MEADSIFITPGHEAKALSVLEGDIISVFQGLSVTQATLKKQCGTKADIRKTETLLRIVNQHIKERLLSP